MKYLYSILFTFSVFVVCGQTLDEENHFSNKGKIFIETEYGRFIAIADVGPAYGISGGYFLLEDFAVKFNTGFYKLGINDSDFIYGLGAKFYVAGRVPLEFNYTRYKDFYLKEYSVGYAILKRNKFYLEPSISLVLGGIDSYVKPAIRFTFLL